MNPGGSRRLSFPLFIGIVIVYLAIIQGLGLLIGVDTGGSDAKMPNPDAVLHNMTIPIAVSMVFAVVVATWLGWWPEILHETKRVQRWVWFVPVSMIVVAVIAIDYGNLLDQKVSLVLSLALTVAMVGFTEELMFRGIGIKVLRDMNLTEGKVALWSSVIFGLVHLSNVFNEGFGAIGQAAVVSTSGYFLYLARRVSGTILLAMFVHGLWDFSLLSSLIGPEVSNYLGSGLVLLLQLVLIVVLVVRRKKIELPGPVPA